MVFAEKYGWQDIDSMPVSERRRKIEIIEALVEGQKAKASRTSAPAAPQAS